MIEPKIRPADMDDAALAADLMTAAYPAFEVDPVLTRFPPVRGRVWTGYTCCHPDHRGRGLARAVKLQSLAQAIDLGVPAVFTDNDSQNAPILHINEELGYAPRAGLISLLKRVES